MKQVKDLCYEQLKTLSDEQIAEAIGNSDPSSSTDFLTNLTVKQTGSKPEGDDHVGEGGERMDGVCEEEEDKEIVITVSDVSDGLDDSSGPETEEAAGSRTREPRAEAEEGGVRAEAEEGRSRARAGGEEGGTRARARAEAEEGRSRARAGGEEGGMRARAKAEEGRSRARAEEKEVGARAEAEEGKTRVGARAEARGEKEEGVSGENLAKSVPNSSVRPISTTSGDTNTARSSSSTETSDQLGDRQEVATVGNTEHRAIASRDEGSTSRNAGDSVEEREGAIASRELTADELLEMDLRRRALEAELRKTNADRGKAGGSRASRKSGQDPEASQPSQSVEISESSRSSRDVEIPKSVKGSGGSRKESGVECEDLIAIHPEYRDSEEEGVEEGEGRVSRRKERRRDRRKQEGRNSRRKGREEEGRVGKSEENRRKGRGEEECGGKGVEERSKRDGEGREGLRLEEERRGSDGLEVGRLLEERLRQRALQAMLARRAEQAAILQQQSHTDSQHMSA